MLEIELPLIAQILRDCAGRTKVLSDTGQGNGCLSRITELSLYIEKIATEFDDMASRHLKDHTPKP